MRELYDAFHSLELVVFVLLGVVAVWQWVKLRTEPAAWIAGAFGVLALAVGVDELIPAGASSGAAMWAAKVEVTLIVLFPYLLYRFMASLAPMDRRVDVMAAGLTAAVAVWIFLLHLPGPNEDQRTAVLLAYLFALALQWLVLSALVVSRLFRQGAGQPSPARSRMRTLSLGSAGLTTAFIVFLVAPPGEGLDWLDIAGEALALGSGPLFLLGFAPPRIVRVLWRQSESSGMRRTEAGLMEALDPGEVARNLVPQVARLVATDAAALVALDGRVIHAIGMEETEAQDLAGGAATGEIGPEPSTKGPPAIALRMSTAWLVMRISPFAPFFGQEERQMLQRVAVLGDLALERVELMARVLEHAQRLAEAQQLSRIGSWEWDVRSGAVEWSEQLYRNYGLDPGAFEPGYEAFLERVHPDDREGMRAALTGATESRTGFERELRVIRPDGTTLWVHARGRVVLDENGEPVKVIGTSQDITDRVRQDELRRSQARAIEEQAKLLDLAYDAIFVRDPQGYLRYWNEGPSASTAGPLRRCSGRQPRRC